MELSVGDIFAIWPTSHEHRVSSRLLGSIDIGPKEKRVSPSIGLRRRQRHVDIELDEIVKTCAIDSMEVFQSERHCAVEACTLR